MPFLRTSPRFSTPLVAPTLLAASLLLAGCAHVGPVYHGAPQAAPLAQARGSFLRAADATRDPPAARWWEALGDPALTTIIDDALKDSPDVAAARARITETRAVLAGNRAALLPSASIGATVPYANYSSDLFGASTSGRSGTTFYATSFDASWEPDLFGEQGSKITGARANAEAAEASLADAQVALSSELARVYIALRAEQANLALLTDQAAIDRTLLDQTRQRFTGGTIPAQQVDSAKATLAQTESDLAASRARATALGDQLAVLAGREPGAFDSLVATPAPIPAPEGQVAVGDPAELLRHRPDIRVAERQLASANAELGARIADRFPKVSFTGLLGLGGRSASDAINPSSLIALVLPQIKWTLFDGGRAKAQVANARGTVAEAEARYHSTVLKALEDAEGALTRFGAGRVALAKAIEASDATVHVAELQQQRAAAGTLSGDDALRARRQALRARLQTNSARADLATAFVSVEKSLGLGWTAESDHADAAGTGGKNAASAQQ